MKRIRALDSFLSRCPICDQCIDRPEELESIREHLLCHEKDELADAIIAYQLIFDGLLKRNIPRSGRDPHG